MVESEDIRIAFEDKEAYEKLTTFKGSPLYNKQFSDVFMLALAIGFQNNKGKKLSKRIPNIHLSALDREDRWLINSVAIAKEKDIDILLEPKKIFGIAEEYANWGVKVLFKEIMNNSVDYDKVLEEEMRNILSSKK